MAAQKEFINPPGLANLKTFSQVATARDGKMVFISGQVSWNDQGQPLHAGDLKAQTEQTFANLKIALAAAGASFNDVVKLVLYVVNLKPEDRAAIVEVRSRYLDRERPPAMTMVGVTALVQPELLIEVEAVAVVD